MNCPLCLHNSSSYIPVINKRELLICRNCKFVFVNIHKLKKDNLGIAKYKFLKEYLEEERSYRKYFEEKINLLHKYTKPGSLLDIGSSAGFFLEVAHKHGWAVTGVEPSKVAAKYSQNKKFLIKIDIFEKLKFKPNSLDAISAFQVIEHSYNPGLFLAKVYKTLEKSGVLILTTPDKKGFLATILGIYWFGYYNPEHLSYFDKNTLKIALEKSGFKPIIIFTEKSRELTLSYIFIRIFSYYYDFQVIKLVAGQLHKFLRLLNWVKIREPKVNLVVIAQKI